MLSIGKKRRSNTGIAAGKKNHVEADRQGTPERAEKAAGRQNPGSALSKRISMLLEGKKRRQMAVSSQEE
ncbi:MAG: hypothetical protein IJM57_01435 [Lachnospiraceae bacterium]|nr:hypothetical protein [Lachnospiraceae bacterium]